MNMSSDHLLVRGADLLVIGVRWSGFDLLRDAVTGRTHLVATEDDARIVITFPPQAVVEEKRDGADGGRRDARVSGPTRVTFRLTRAFTTELSADGLLQALAIAGGGTLAPDDGDEHDTAIEIPWHLVTSVVARSAGVAVGAAHTAAALASPSGVLGLWHSRLQALDGGPRDARLALRPLSAGPDVGLDTAPLSADNRQRIKDESARALPTATRLELSALGGSVTASGLWPNFRWDHELTLGRDQHVRVESKGVLYPFGHRATLVQTADRVFNPPPTPSDPAKPASASLQRRRTLVVTQPVVGPVQGNVRLARLFPFSEVEICQREFHDLQNPRHESLPREPIGALEFELDALRERARVLVTEMETFLDSLPRPFETYLESDFGFAPGFRAARDSAAALATEVGELERRQGEIVNLLEHLNPETDQAEISALIAELTNINALLPRMRADARAAQAEADRALADCSAEFSGFPLSIQDLRDQGDFTALEHRDVERQIGELVAEFNAGQIPVDVFVMPHWSPGVPVRFPLRCAGVHGDVFFSVPLIFVEDTQRDETPHFAAFDTLSDPRLPPRLSDAWALHSRIPLPGVRLDLVRSADPKPCDTQEVHELTLAGEPHGGAFRTTVVRAAVELPALRALVPGAASRVVLAYADDFAQRGDAVDVALKPVGVDAIVVDFTDQPQRSGGLVAPRFAVDAIARTLGPVTEATLPNEDRRPDLAAYAGATLLGFPLSLLIAPDTPHGRPLPPSIVPVVENGQPIGVRMTWPNLMLQSHQAFQTRSGSAMTLSVERSRDTTTIDCTVSNFDLVLPAGETKLLTVGFGSVAFTQRAGRDPDLKITGLDVKFAGSLALLTKLQEALGDMLGGAAPTVRVSPSGISAGFALALPSVATGAFLLRNIAVSIGVDVPFEKKPVTVSLGFSRRENPFNLSVLLFGGGGYIEMQVGGSGLTRLEASLEFGAAVAIDFAIASGEVHAMGGISFVKTADNEIEVGGFLRIGGSVEVLGLVSVSVELLVTLKYESENNRLVGRATLVIEVDLTFIAESITLDSGVWIIAGDDREERRRDDPLRDGPLRIAGALEDELDFAAWRQYHEAFVS